MFASHTGTFKATVSANDVEVEIFDGSANVTYTVTLRDKKSETKRNLTPTTEGIKEKVTIPFNQLKPCTEYTVEVDNNCTTSGDNSFNIPTGK